MATFENMLATANQGKLTEAANWLQTLSAKTMITPQRLINADKTRLTNIPFIGRMYLFNYDPKYKKELPYYDRFPLIFPFLSANVIFGSYFILTPFFQHLSNLSHLLHQHKFEHNFVVIYPHQSIYDT